MTPPDPTNCLILIVEDDADCAEAIAGALLLEGFQVVIKANGLEALAYLEAKRLPDVILLDLTMPVMDGATFIAEKYRHREWSAIPVILISGDRGIERAASELKVAGHLRKPFDSADLFELIAFHLSNRLKNDAEHLPLTAAPAR